jgi:4-hydroxy-3-polyprenylbenzoate decarboxylase
MTFSGLQDYIDYLRQTDQLIEIFDFIDPVYEITEITDRFMKQQGRAILFHNTGTAFPVITNMMANEQTLSAALRVDNPKQLGSIVDNVLKVFKKKPEGLNNTLKIVKQFNRLSSYTPRIKRGRGACQDVIIRDPDIQKLPVLHCWPEDGGKFVTLPLVHTKDPVNGTRNTGMYRMQIFDEKTTGMHWHRHKGGAGHYEKYREKGRKMPVAVALGGDPVYTYTATAPLPDNMDEYLLAGILRKKPVKLVKCITQEIEVPEDAEFIIEGFVDPSEELVPEGPFGDHTGFYSKKGLYPSFHITCITHRHNPVYPATIVGVPPMEDFWFARATERLFLPVLQNTVLPELSTIDLPAAGVGHNLTIARIKKRYPGHAIKVMNALWGAGQMMFNKLLIVIDETMEYQDYYSFVKQIMSGFTSNDLFLSRGPLDVLDHSTHTVSFGGKLCLDATVKTEEETSYFYDNNRVNNTISGDYKELLLQNDSIAFVNDHLTEKGIPVVIIGLRKIEKEYISGFKKIINSDTIYEGIKAFILIDSDINWLTDYLLVWYASNNLNPDKDIHIITNTQVIADCTRKDSQYDRNPQQWPGIAVSSIETIKKVDKIIKEVLPGIYLESPSAMFY